MKNFVKRLFDLFFSALGLILLSPLLLCISIWIKFDSKGPVMYRGLRVGLHEKTFRIFKFRSMTACAERLGATSTSIYDSRLTNFGKYIRKYKLDELPQLINVFLGDMSFVGPRPEVKIYVDQYSEKEKKILSVKPGITDLSSLKFHNEGEIIAASGIENADKAYEVLIRPHKLKLQLFYVTHQNFCLDIIIIYKTLLKLI